MKKRNPGLGALIREHRLSKGLSQAALAERLSKRTAMFISLLELNKSKVPPALWGHLIVHLGISEKKVISLLVNHYKQNVLNEIEAGKRVATKKPLKMSPKMDARKRPRS